MDRTNGKTISRRTETQHIDVTLTTRLYARVVSVNFFTLV